MASNGDVPDPLAADGADAAAAAATTCSGPSAAENHPPTAIGAADQATRTVQHVRVGATQDAPVSAEAAAGGAAAANDGDGDAPSSSATPTAVAAAAASASNRPTDPDSATSTSADWGGSRALSDGEEDALLLSEFLREYWPVFASPTAPVPPRSAAAAGLDGAEEGQAAANGGADADADAAATSTADATAAIGNDSPSGPRKPPTITPRVVQDAARILAEREKRVYHVAGDCAVVGDKKEGGDASDTADGDDADVDANADAVVPDLVDEDHAAAVCDMEQTLIRLGVLGTKALAEDVLVVRPQRKSYTASGKRRGKRGGTEGPDLDRVTHFSALLNLPGSEHFRQLLGPVNLGGDAAAAAAAANGAGVSRGMSAGYEEDQWHHRALPLPPNMLTYPAYLRLALMVSCLSSDDDEPGRVPEPILQACKSPLCAFLPSISIGSDLRPTRGIEHSHAKGRDVEESGGGGGKRKQPGRVERDLSHGAAQSAGWKWARSSDALLLSADSTLTGSDVVALWVRAQRNTGAWRQLLGMFRFVTTNIGDNSSIALFCNSDKEDHSASNYQAIYVGNHRHGLSREDESKRVDSLVTWAATNQVLFSWGPIRDEIAKGHSPELGRSGNKRRGGKAVGRQNVKFTKRSFDDTPGHPIDEDCDEEPYAAPEWMNLYNKPLSSRISSTGSQLPDSALVALQSFTIRLLAALHRPILTVLYTSKPDSFLVLDDDASPSQQLLSRLVGQNLPEKIKDEMLRSRSTSDRTLSRIDRRLATGKYIPDKGDEVREKRGIHYHFYDLVRFVLKSLRHSLDSTDKVSRNAVTEAIEDWARIRERYLNPDESKNWWAMNGWLSISPGSIQSALLAPWGESEKCQGCNQDVPSTESDETLVCSCCATSFVHSKCQPSKTAGSRPLSSLLHSYAPLRQVYSLRSPAGILPIPDYTKPHLRNTIKWSSHSITLNRPIVPGERPPSWGLGINHLETAAEALDKVLGQTFDATRLSCTDTLSVSKELGTPILVRLPCPPELAGGGNKEGWRAILVGKCLLQVWCERCSLFGCRIRIGLT